VEEAGGWLLLELRGREVVFTLDPEVALADWIRLSRLAEVQRPAGLRRRILGFAGAYGRLGVPAVETPAGVGEPFPAWVEELRLTGRWWRAGQLIAHGALRAATGGSLDARVVGLLRERFGLPPQLPAAAVMALAQARLVGEMADRLSGTVEANAQPTLLLILQARLAERLRRAVEPRAG